MPIVKWIVIFEHNSTRLFSDPFPITNMQNPAPEISSGVHYAVAKFASKRTSVRLGDPGLVIRVEPLHAQDHSASAA